MGGVLSPLLANVYLNEFDRWAETKWEVNSTTRQRNRAAGRGNYKAVRYADDFVVVSNDTRAGVERAKQEIHDFLATKLHLELSAEKTVITHVNDGFDFLGFHIQRCRPEGRWVPHLRPTAHSKERVKAKIKSLTTRGWTWLDEVTRLSTLNAIVKGWAEYYKHTSLLVDIEEISRYAWHRYLLWLLKKHKGWRKRQLIAKKTRVIFGRTRWTAEMHEGGQRLRVHQWLPTRQELNRTRYRNKGIGGFPHPYLFDGPPKEEDYPMGDVGPSVHIYTDTIGVRSSRSGCPEPIDIRVRMLRAKVRDNFTCQRCDARTNLRVHHRLGMKSHRLDELITLCEACHKAQHGFGHSRSTPA